MSARTRCIPIEALPHACRYHVQCLQTYQTTKNLLPSVSPLMYPLIQNFLCLIISLTRSGFPPRAYLPSVLSATWHACMCYIGACERRDAHCSIYDLCYDSNQCQGLQEVYDLDAPMDATTRKLIDAAGAGQSNMSPGWLTELGRLWGGTSVRQNKQPSE